MYDLYTTLTGKIDRRSPRHKGDINSPIERQNLLSRDGRCKKVKGTSQAITTTLSGIPTWIGRYHSRETGVTSPKSFVYTQDGIIWSLDDNAKTATSEKTGLNLNAYPRHWLYKKGEQNLLYVVDGLNLYKHDGNNDNTFDLIDVLGNGSPPNVIDVIEHKDRLFLISKTSLFVSKNLDPDVFTDPNDSIELIVGSGKGKNLALGKIGDILFILNTEGIYVLIGDLISAVASTFSIDLADPHKIIAGRTAVTVEKAINFLADDLNIWSFDGAGCKKLSHSEKIEDFISDVRDYLDRAVATYEDNYYKLSVVGKGETQNSLEFWWDAFEDKIDFVKGRHVSCYMQTDPTVETKFSQITKSNEGSVDYADMDNDFDGVAIDFKLRSRDIMPSAGQNVRFTAFYPELAPSGDWTATFRYILGGRLWAADGNSDWEQSLKGEVIKVSPTLDLNNQAQMIDRVRPKINYANGESVSFEITGSARKSEFEFFGIGADFILKGKKKKKAIGA